jgi:hypothetical protein
LHLYYACYLLVAGFGIISILVVTVGCSWPSGYYWAFFINSTACDSQVSEKSNRRLRSPFRQLKFPFQATRWQILTALDVTTELGLLIIPVMLVWKLQMPWTKKAVLLIAFYLRLPVIALSLGRNVYTLRLRHQASDAGLDSAIVTIWLEVQLAYALASSTLSALKAFTESFNSGFGLGFARGKSESENSSYALSQMSRSNTGAGTSIASRSKPDRHKGLDDDDTGTIFPSANISKDKNNRFLSFTKTSPLKLRSDLIGPRSGATTIATSENDSRWNHDNSDADVVHPGHRVRESDLNVIGEHGRVPEGLVILRETELSIRRDLASDYLRYTKQ